VVVVCYSLTVGGSLAGGQGFFILGAPLVWVWSGLVVVVGSLAGQGLWWSALAIFGLFSCL
jgi:hypothetical protein